jgi:hypothetical protein
MVGGGGGSSLQIDLGWNMVPEMDFLGILSGGGFLDISSSAGPPSEGSLTVLGISTPYLVHLSIVTGQTAIWDTQSMALNQSPILQRKACHDF